MDIKQAVVASSDNMLSLFVGADIIHPFRFEPYLQIVIPFDEYIEFVERMVQQNLDILSFPIQRYRTLLETRDTQKLRKYYLYDMSAAVANEVVLGNAYRREGTVITHLLTGVDDEISIYDVPDVLNKIDKEYREKAESFLRRSITRKLDDTELTGHNNLLWQYAIYLRTLAIAPTTKLYNLKSE